MSCQANEKSDSQILGKTIEKNNLLELTNEIKTDDGVTYDDKMDFIRGIQFLRNTPDSIIGKTVAELIQYANNRMLMDNMNAAEQMATRFEMQNLTQFKLAKFEPLTLENGTDNNQLTYEIYNTSDQQIDKITGMIKLFNNTNNALIKQFPVNVTDPIETGKGRAQSVNYVHDPSNNRDLFIRENLQTQLIRWEWVPDTVNFSSGKSLSLPRQ
jgi:hypothetical protein